MRPGVKQTLRELARKARLSFSATCAEGLEVYARAKIRDQEETLFEPRMQAMIRREIRASDNRHIYFEMRNAIAAEQTRILITDLYKRQLQKEGVPLKEINKKLDNTYTMARDNILRKTKTPQLKNLLDAWWRSTEDLLERQAGEATDSHAQKSPRQEGDTDRGEAGTDKSQA
jgi:DNA helicase IV